MSLPNEYIITIPAKGSSKKTIKVNLINKKTGELDFDGMHIIVHSDRVKVLTFHHQLELKTDTEEPLDPIHL